MARNENGTQFGTCRRTLYRTAKQSKAGEVLQSARQGVAHRRAVGGVAIQVKSNRGAAGRGWRDHRRHRVARRRRVRCSADCRSELRAKDLSLSCSAEGGHPQAEREAPARWGLRRFEDRVVQTAMKLVLEPIFEADFHRLAPTVTDHGEMRRWPAKAIRNDLYRGAWGVVEIDFRSYFTTIPHDKLMTPHQTARGGWESCCG
jgi:RNA-directed DNA polymerase